MKDQLIDNNVDKYEFAEQEHKAGFHDTYQKDCESCYRENRLIEARNTVNRQVGRMDNYPPGFNLRYLD